MKTGGQTKYNANTSTQKEFLLDSSGQSSIVNLGGFKRCRRCLMIEKRVFVLRIAYTKR